MQFLDEATIYLASGTGGDGCLSFRREKFIPNGGPDGGNGGRGGHIIFVANPQLTTLIDYRYQQHFTAARGGHGMGKNRHGANAPDLTIPVPLGTEILDLETGSLLADLTTPGQQIVLLKGGKGGRGNAMFANSVNQAPRRFELGVPGQERKVRLQLKLLADIGLLGLPNAGKSTFLSVVSNARPKIADYPFTTLAPQLGMVRHQGLDIVVADLPGLIEGAAEGKGLGHRFLKHLSRTAGILHLVDGTNPDAAKHYKTLRQELKQFEPALTKLKEVIVLTKADVMTPEEVTTAVAAFEKATRKKGVRVLSSLTKEGLDQVLADLAKLVKARRQAAQAAAAKAD